MYVAELANHAGVGPDTVRCYSKNWPAQSRAAPGEQVSRLRIQGRKPPEIHPGSLSVELPAGQYTEDFRRCPKREIGLPTSARPD